MGVEMKKLSSEWIYKYYKGLEEHNIENHGLIIMQNGETVFEEYAEPYSKDMPHTLFSVTKSIVSTAAGFAIDEGLFTLDSKIIDLFPEYTPCESDQWDSLTVRSVLTMQSNKEFTFLQDMRGNYTEMFMKAPFRKKGGFLYSNNDAHVVAALVQKASGMSLTDYLTPRLFEPLGIDTPFWETNSIGECIGGTGGHFKLRDLAKICQCYADGGKYNGKQVIPEFWTREATKIQVLFKNDGKTKEGYGYLFWIKNDVFSMTGMFGQLISYIPQHNAVVVTMNCCIDEGNNSRLAEEVLVKAFSEESDPQWDKKLEAYLESRKLKLQRCNNIPKIPTNKIFYITRFSDIRAKIMFPQGLINRSLTCSFAKRPKENMNELSFELNESTLVMKWKEEEDKIIINCALNGNPQLSECEIKGYQYKIWSYGFMKDGKFVAVIKPLNTLSTQYFTFDFKENQVKISCTGTPSFIEFIKKNAGGADFFKAHPKIKAFSMSFLEKFLSSTEKPVKFIAR